MLFFHFKVKVTHYYQGQGHRIMKIPNIEANKLTTSLTSLTVQLMKCKSLSFVVIFYLILITNMLLIYHQYYVMV